MWRKSAISCISPFEFQLYKQLRHSLRLQETRKTPKAPAEVENPIWLPLNAHFHQAKFS